MATNAARGRMTFFAVALLLVLAPFCKAQAPAAQVNALTALYTSLDGNSWTDDTNWLVGNPCTVGNEWYGVTCNVANDEVVSVVLSNNNLSGVLSDISGLDGVTQLKLDGNAITSISGAQIGGIVSLLELDLSSNRISGTIPSGLGSLVNLLFLDLNSNDFDGVIPASFSGLTKLTDLDLGFNLLDSPIPSAVFTALTKLEILYLDNNGFSEPLPASLFTSTKLVELIISNNQFTGSFPASIQFLDSLIELDASFNQISTLPPQMPGMASLERLNLGYNSLSNPALVILGDITTLTFLAAPSNTFTGDIPDDLEDLVNLKHLDLSLNNFDSFEAGFTFAGFTSLEHLNLGANQIDDPLPTTIFGLTTLEYLDLGANALTGAVPTSLGTLVNLVHLDLSDNALTSFPTAISGLSSIEFLDLGNNPTSPPYPSEILSLTTLKHLYLNALGATGAFPTQFGNLNNLITLDVSDNSFTGRFPTFLSNTIEEITIAGNEFDGPVPELPPLFPSLKTINLSDNNFNGYLPACVTYEPEYVFFATLNRFTCDLPEWCDGNDDAGHCVPCIGCDVNGDDKDSDGICGVDDNCPLFYNPAQASGDAPECGGSGSGDPHMVGFEGQRFDFKGKSGHNYNILTDYDFQVNAEFGINHLGPHSVAPGVMIKKMAFMTHSHTIIIDSGAQFKGEDGFIMFDGVLVAIESQFSADGLSVSFKHFSASSVDLGLSPGDRIVALANVIYEGAYEFSVFFVDNDSNPGNPNQQVEYLYHRRFLDFTATIFDDSRHPHGVLGQTARPVEPGTPLDNWVLEGSSDDYVVHDGLTGTDFTFNLFQ